MEPSEGGSGPSIMRPACPGSPATWPPDHNIKATLTQRPGWGRSRRSPGPRPASRVPNALPLWSPRLSPREILVPLNRQKGTTPWSSPAFLVLGHCPREREYQGGPLIHPGPPNLPWLFLQAVPAASFQALNIALTHTQVLEHSFPKQDWATSFSQEAL